MKKIVLVPLMFAFLLSGCSGINQGDNPGQNLTLDSIAITAEPTKTEYLVNEQLDLAGLVVTAKYTDGTSLDVTSKIAIVTQPDLSTLGEKTVIISYTENGISRYDSFRIVVKTSGEDNPPVQTYTITFDSNGGSGSMSALTKNKGDVIQTAPACKFGAPEGKEFDKWVDTNGNAISFPYTVNGNAAFKAAWKDVVYSISFDTHSKTLNVDDSFTINVTYSHSGLSGAVLRWSSNDATIATVDNGVVTAKSGGNTQIKAYWDINANSVQDTDEPSDSCSVVVLAGTLDDYGYNHYNGYYGQLSWTNATDLATKLHNIISKDVKYLRYDSSSSAPTNWETNTVADHVYDDLEMLDVVYSQDHVMASATNSSWQREHAFVASLMTGVITSAAVGTKQGRAVDFHNLFAASSTGNTSRSDKNFGVADDPSAQGYQNIPGNYASTNKIFEPSDNDKGRLARAILYMMVMYNSDEEEDVSLKLNYNAADQATYGQQSKTVHIPMVYKPLTLSKGLAENSLVDFTKYHYAETEDIQALVAQYGEDEEGYADYVRDNAAYSIGLGETIVGWASRPVDYQEYQHNQSVYGIKHSYYDIAQNNRNPFVDYPELVDYLFGDKVNEAGDIKYLRPTSYGLNLESDGIHHYAIKTATREFEVGDTFSKDSYELVGIKTDMTQVAVTDAIDSTESYTFKDSDIGEQTMTIKTDKNTIELKVKVKEVSEKYSYEYLFDTKADFGTDNFTENETREVTLAGQKWNAIATNAVTLGNKNSPFKAVQIGTGTSGQNANKFTLMSKESFTNVDRMKLIVNAAASTSYTVTVKIGSTIVETFQYTGNSKENIIKELTVNPQLTGVVTIEFTNVSKALYIGGISINENK